MRAVYEERLGYIRAILTELGFEGEDLEVRTRLFVCDQTWGRPMFWWESKARSKRTHEAFIDS